ncbi:MAG: ParB/RepB/Spo0J family partition protein [Rhodothermales bacterium]|nr:ParB/RepB/Spo0J family partition protein [Rhodothermales bacterium]
MLDTQISLIDDLIAELAELPEPERIETLNHIRARLHEVSPFRSEPVDNIQWIPVDRLQANDYNPNVVAPPEMELLALSVREDGYTQPIVAWQDNGHYEVIDGFHRNRVGREDETISARLHGYLPVVVANEGRVDRGDRIASTIRHNRARGKHQVGAMADIVIELKRRNWSDKKIGKHLGMEPDEVLRLSQITGLAEMFADRDFSEAWEADVLTLDDGDSLEVDNA